MEHSEAYVQDSWEDVLSELKHYWPQENGEIQCQQKYNSFQPDVEKRWTPGCISYAWVTWGQKIPYSFNRKTLELQEPTEWLTALRDKIEGDTGVKYDSVLINYCVEGAALSGHVDKGPTINVDVDITSISFCKFPGFKRRFFVFTDPKTKKVVPLGHGDRFTGPLGTHVHGLLAPYKKDLAKSTSIVLTFRKMPSFP